VQFLLEANPDAIVIIAYWTNHSRQASASPNMAGSIRTVPCCPSIGRSADSVGIANGETTTGVTTMRIDAVWTPAKCCSPRNCDRPAKDHAELAARLAEISAPLMAETCAACATVPLSQSRKITPKPPLHHCQKEGGRINWSLTAERNLHRMRGFTPWPGAFAFFRGSACQLFRRSGV